MKKTYIIGALMMVWFLSWCANQINNETIKTRSDYTNDEKFNIHMCLMGWGEDCDSILDKTNKDLFGDAILEQCEIMKWMPICDEYFETVSAMQDVWNTFDLSSSSNYLNQRSQQVVELKDGDTFEITLENINKTINNKKVRMMAYNGSIPWPLIKVKQGSSITLNVTNNIADIESAVHSHWLRLKDTEDGVPVSMWGWDISMKLWDTNSYQLEFPDAGIYRYHPHVREDLQQELGMYGNFLVLPANDDYRNKVDDEQLLVLDDIQLDEEGIAPIYKEYTNQAIMGRFGTDYLINWSEDYTLQLTQWKVTRLYVTNTANVRPFNISIPWVQMKLVGSDLGAYERESIIESLLIAPAERYVVELLPAESGTYELQFINPAFTTKIATVVVESNTIPSEASKLFAALREVADTIQDIDKYREYFDKPVDKTLRLDMTLNGKTKADLSLQMPHAESNMTARLGGLRYHLSDIEWEDEMYDMNIVSTDENTKRQLIDEDTNKVSMEIDDRVFDQWDLVKVRIFNDGEWLHPMQHPIHFHGQRFLVINKNGIPNDNFVWKDTVLTLPWEYLDLLIDMSNPGKRVAHCHIAEHMHAGMMMRFEVLPQ